jgi:hypothetical protein
VHIGGTGTGNNITIQGTNLFTPTNQTSSPSMNAQLVWVAYPSITIADVSVAEGSGGGVTNLIFTVTVNPTSGQSVSVDYTTADGTALSTADYTATSATLTISAGQTTGTITVSVGADTTYEANETLNLTISNAVHGIITYTGNPVNSDTVVGTILNDDFGGLNDTGLITWGNATFNNLTTTQTLFPLQDADKGRDSAAMGGGLTKVGASSNANQGFDFTKLNANGQPLPNQTATYTTTPWDCVKDNVTGLYWEVKTTTVGLHKSTNTYTWVNSNVATNGGSVGTSNGGTCTGSGCDTEQFVAAVNLAGMCGFNDWRLPTREELRSIVDYGISSQSPAIDTGYFPNTVAAPYWSASPYSGSVTQAWEVFFNFVGGFDKATKISPRHVRLVRGGL